MALIKCDECGKEISDKAKACPNCGCPIDEKNEVTTELKKDSVASERKNRREKRDKKEKKHIFAWFMCISTFYTAFSSKSFGSFILLALAGIIVCPKFIKYAKEKKDKEIKPIMQVLVWFLLMFFAIGLEPSTETTDVNQNISNNENCIVNEIENTDSDNENINVVDEKESEENQDTIQKNLSNIGLNDEQIISAKDILTKIGITEMNSFERHLEENDVLNAFSFNANGYNFIITINAPDNSVFSVSSGTLELYKQNEIEPRNVEDWTLNDTEKAYMIQIGEGLVKECLKSPSTAKFPGSFLMPYDGWGMSQEGLIYKISSYVDSQNSFGATVRSNFYIEFTYDENGEFKLLKFTLDGKSML